VPRARKPKKPVESPKLPRSFDTRALEFTKAAYPRPDGLGTWTEDGVEAARDAQIRGHFREPVILARSLLTEPAIYAAMINRLAPHRALKRKIDCGERLTGTPAAILEEARLNFEGDTSTGLPRGVLADDFARIAMHEVAIDQIHWEPRADGSRMDPYVQAWPMENVDFFEIPPDGSREHGLFAFTAPTQALDENGNTTYLNGGWVRVVHGDGRWIVHAKHADRPWQRGALVALARLWVDQAFGRRDRSNNAASHGDDKWIGTLPEGMLPEDDNGKVMLAELAKLYQPRRAMVVPHGCDVKRHEALGSNWQIFPSLLNGGVQDAQRVLLGQDGTMTNSGGNYIKAWGLFNVRQDIVEGDCTAIGSGVSTGLLRPWSIINFGRWDRLTYAWQMPDADEDARRTSIAALRVQFWADVTSARAAGAVVDQQYFDDLADDYGIRAPTLSPAGPPVAPPASTSSDGPPAVTAHRQPLRAASCGR
jgi:hypothetical protein